MIVRAGRWPRRTFAVVPAKSFERAKSRLAPVLPPSGRAALARGLLAHVLGVLDRCPLEGVLVLSSCPEVATLARAHGALVRPDRSSDLAGIVDAGLRAVAALGAGAALVLPGDLPRLAPRDVGALADLLGEHDVALAPDRQGTGTGALGLAPPAALRSQFGHADSFRRHLLAAARAGLRTAVLERPGLAWDVDLPADLRLAI